jgi:hypothetical protein
MPRRSAITGDIQSKWASLWHMHQAAAKREKLVPGASTTAVEEGAPAVPYETCEPVIDEAQPRELVTPAIEVEEGSAAGGASNSNSTEVESSPAVIPWTSARTTRKWLDGFAGQATPWARISKLWRSHRATVYVIVAALLLGLVLSGWQNPRPNPSRAARPQLTLFEKVLVALGLAVPPTSTVASPGNPSTQVWVDLHTALYYCPGSELYGKTEGGRYSSQKDAQLDQFEPASHKACN